MDNGVLRDIIEIRARRGKAPGLSGWTESLILPLLEDPGTLGNFSLFIMDLCNGRIVGSGRNLLLASVLIPLRKPKGGIRPIAIGECFVKIAKAYMLSLVDAEQLKFLMAPVQFGIMSKGGVERVVHSVQAHLDGNPDHCCVALDITNGFNSVSRRATLDVLYQTPSLQVLWRLVDWCYSKPSALVVRDGSGIKEVLGSEQGVHQGCILGSLLFCLTIQPVLLQALRYRPPPPTPDSPSSHSSSASTPVPRVRPPPLTEAKLLAIVDDITCVGPVDEVMRIIKELKKELLKLNLSLSPEKCLVLYNSEDCKLISDNWF